MPVAEPSPASTPGSTIIAAEPQLFVSDMEAAIAFYAEKLGFRLVFASGEPAFYAQITRDGAKLNLRRVAEPVFAKDFRAQEPDALSATLTLENAEPLFWSFRPPVWSFINRCAANPGAPARSSSAIRMEI